MKIDIYGRKMTVSESMAAYATRKVEKLGKFFGDEPAVQVTFSTERGMQTAEIAFEVRGMHFRAKERTSDMQASIDGAVASIDRQIQKNKTKLAKRLRHESFVKAMGAMTDYSDESFEIIREKTLDVKPMTVEDAILQMNLLGHTFFVYKNSENEKNSIVYKSKDGNYGIIEIN